MPQNHQNKAEAPPTVLLCHFVDGRTLLTDADGLYNAFLVAAAEAARGDVVIAVTGVPNGTGALADATVIDQLVDYGQTSLRSFYEARRFLVWDDAPSADQVDHVLLRSRRLAPVGGAVPLPDGIRRHAALAPSSTARRRRTSSSPGGGRAAAAAAEHHPASFLMRCALL
mmetsp:Transcript_7933/g.32774  ORF Transcript_7933/g.32774 Transcript_7933/m.32774 type:complete len:170 (-) Transcript_7933:118-627(-)